MNDAESHKDREEPIEQEPEQGFIRELSQFFIVPSLIVLLCVGIFVMFGLITSDRKSAREFLQEVKHNRGGDRWQAAFELSRLIAQQPELGSDERLVAEIASTLREESSGEPAVRKYLVIALEHLGNPAAGPALIEALADPEADVRLQAARALSVMEDLPEAVEPLSRLLQEEDPVLRKVAAYALGQLGDPAAVEHLLPRLDDPVEDVRWNAALALAVLGDRAGLGVIARMLDRQYLDSIEGITEEQKASAMINAIQAVYLLDAEELTDKIRWISQNDPNLRVRDLALKILAR